MPAEGAVPITAAYCACSGPMKLRKRLDLARDAEKVAGSVPGLIVEKWVGQA